MHRIGILGLAVAACAAAASAQTTEFASGTAAGLPANNASHTASLSADGRYVAFSSLASNLVGHDTNGVEDVFVLDRVRGTTIRVSVDSTGAQGNGRSWFPAISADGKHVVFASEASNLAPGDANGMNDIFVRDLDTGTTTRESVSTAGVEGNSKCIYDAGWGSAASGPPDISADGHFIVFTSMASNLVSGDTNGTPDIFRRDRWQHVTLRANLTTSGGQMGGFEFGEYFGNAYPSVSDDGRFVTFDSGIDIGASWVRDLNQLTTTALSSSSGLGHIAGSGDFIVFTTYNKLVPDDTDNHTGVYVWNRLTGAYDLASRSSTGAVADANCTYGSLSADGRFVVFESAATNLVPNDTNGMSDIFLRDRQLGTTLRVSLSSTALQNDVDSEYAAISDNGAVIGFEADDGLLVSPDENMRVDVFVHDTLLAPQTPWSTVGAGLAGTSGVPALLGTGDLAGLAPMSLDLSGARPAAPLFLVLGVGAANVPFKGGLLVPAPLLVLQLASNAAGQLSLPAAWPAGVPSGATLLFQDWIVDASGPQGFAATNAVLATTP